MSSPSSAPAGAAAAVEALLASLRERQVQPTQEELGTIYELVLPPGASTDAETHWYCAKAPSDTAREAATYLLYLFAFTGERANTWKGKLTQVLTGCAACARAFGAVRRRFDHKYISFYPLAARQNFNNAVDRWQAALIVAELDRARGYGAGDAPSSLLDLPAALLQLFLNEPSSLKDERLAAALDAVLGTRGPTAVSALGVTPLVASLLVAAEKDRREWARGQLACVTRPLAFAEWYANGVGHEAHKLLTGGFPASAGEKWESVGVLLGEGRLQLDSVQQGLLEGRYEESSRARPDQSVMAFIARLLGTFNEMFQCFTRLLSVSPTHHIWAFDTTPELPHTLFSDIKKNKSFQKLLMGDASVDASAKGKEKERSDNPLNWLGDYLLSVADAQKTDSTANSKGFSEVLAKIAGFCFVEAQHERLPVSTRSLAAEAGCRALTTVQKTLGSTDGDALPLATTLDVHSKFVAETAFHRGDASDSASDAARGLLSLAFVADDKELVESVLGLAAIANTERRRLKLLKRRLKPGQRPPSPVKVERLQRPILRRELWDAAYDNLPPSDAVGLALMLNSVAPVAHLEKLDRHMAYDSSDLKAVVNAEEWTTCVRTINSGLRATSDPFAQKVESFALQPNPATIAALWQQPAMAKTVMILLLSPMDAVHDPVINLVQQSFEDVDDRGDCFRVLLERFPCPAMDGLTSFLSTFIRTARIVPEACSLAKWLVRCFTDVLDALCLPAGSEPPLLQSDTFLASHSQGRWMTRRVSDLWMLMTDSLALIFKRTAGWAPYYDNEVMVDWMRDALVFGRAVTEHVRIFESAVLSRTKAKEEGDGTPAKMTNIGKSLIQKLEVMLTDLVGWLRLTEPETLHQTFELIKTILGRVAKTKPDLAEDKTLEVALLEIDKFCRRASSGYNCRLSDDQLGELSELLDEFDLERMDEDEIEFVGETVAADVTARLKAATLDKSSPAPSSKPSSTSSKEERPKASTPKPANNAFAMMMKNAGGKYSPSDRPSSSKPKPTKPRQTTLEEFENDTFMDDLSAADLDILERRAQATSDFKKTQSARVTIPANKVNKEKLVLNLVPKVYPKPAASGSTFTSKFMKELSREHKQQRSDIKRFDAPPRLPATTAIGSGLGAYTGPAKKPAPAKEDSGSSASESSSDDENKGLSALIGREKALIKKAVPAVPERRSIKILGSTTTDVLRARQEERQKAQRAKMRIRPDLTPLFRYILVWDPDYQGPRPPYPPNVAAELGPLRPMPNSFKTGKDYERAILPLFLQELWAQFTKEEKPQPTFQVEVATRAYEDEFLDIDVVLPGKLPMGFSVNEMDIVVIRQGSNKPLFAKVQHFRRSFKDSAIKLRILAKMDQTSLGAKAKVQLRKHVSLSTAIREYAALRGLPYYEPALLNDVLAARSATMPKFSLTDVEDAMKNFSVNEPQAKAILGGMSVKGFALIQGPPGTGKTKTISGLVGKFLSERKTKIPVNGSTPLQEKILVCAPSNAAIDEVCKRLMDGVPSSHGGRIIPKIVRIGVETSVHVAVKDISLDNLVEAIVNTEATANNGGSTELAKIQAELEEVKQGIKDKQDELQRVQGNDQKRKSLETELHTLNTRRTKLGQASSKAKDAARDATRNLDGARRAAREQVLREADIICATLSGAGHESLSSYTFETVIIDEAAQAIEMSCLIPLKYGCQRCIMVGDPNQLPPTTFSQEATDNNFNQSLFVRIAQQPTSTMHLLSIQYRMHPDISELPSKIFYNSQLKDGPDMAKKTAAIWHRSQAFGPYRFFNVDGAETKAGTSTKNSDEAQAAVELYRNLEQQFGGKVNFAMRIGIITMYREQLYELKRKFNDAYGAEILDTIDFNTVDGFQGQEKDIIILSCVRSGPNLRQIGFLKDYRRMNVALTRAKSSLFVIGNAATLERSDNNWNTIVGDARDRGFLINYGPKAFIAGPAKPIEPKKAPAPARTPAGRSSSPVKNGGPAVGAPPVDLKRKQPVSAPSPQEPAAKKLKEGARPSSAGLGSRPLPPANGLSSKPPPPAPSNGNSNPQQAPGPPMNGGAPGPSAGPSAAGPFVPRPLPPPRRPRPPEDVLFMKKKKPKPAPSRAPIDVRAAVNDAMTGRRPPPPK
ncbi:Helicase sen1 [Vanrija pseudolonga]|uniref:Helicase sen1 n=1 Tax=Vanrija pseudolonga TaxID=143232 RepID=A0AAF0Y2K7_9TREE|nr:Helicase sen1 [Vanrija pseudolonga]